MAADDAVSYARGVEFRGPHVPVKRGVMFALLGTLALAAGASLSPADASSYSIVAGGAPVVVTTTSAGENATATFAGTAGQRVSLKISADSITQAYVSILKPDATTLVSPKLMTTAGGFIDTQTLPTTGTYTLLVDPTSTFTGSATLTLYDVPADPTASITPGGAAVTAITTTPGQNASLAFSGSAGQRISARIAATVSQAKVSITNPGGGTLIAPMLFTTAGGFIDTRSLPTTGIYTITIDPQAAVVGSLTVTLYDVPADPTGSITAGGAPVTVTTAVPGQNASLTFAGTAGQRISLKGSSTFSQAKVSIANPGGSALVAPTLFTTAGGFIDTKTLASTGTYTIAIDPQTTATGSITLTLYDVTADPTAVITPGGPATTVTTTVPGQNASLTFAGSAGQRVSLKIASTTPQSRVSISNPDATAFVTPVTVSTAGTFIDTRTLGQTGTYTISVDPQTTGTGSITMTMYNVPADATATITPGGAAVPVATTVPGQNASLSFAGTAGQRVSLKITAVTISQSGVSILNPDGTMFMAAVTVTTAGTFVDPKTLAQTGTYTIVVDPRTTSTGSMTFTLFNVPPDPATSITAGGASVPVTLSTPGQNGTLTFAGAAGQRISMAIASTATQANVSILNPDGTKLVSPVLVSSAGAFIDPRTLAQTGTYTIVVDPQSSYTGTVTLTLYSVPADVSSTITPGGAAATLTIATPGQNGKLTFVGSAGQRVSLRLTNVTIGGPVFAGSQVSILKPDGTALVPAGGVTSNGTFIDTRTLPVAGTYTIVVDPTAGNTGSMTLTLYDVPADVSGTIVRGGAAVTVTTTVPGQNAALTFSGTAATVISLSVSDGIGSTKVSIRKPDGTVLVAPTFASTIGATLPVTGTYMIVIDPSAQFTGSVKLTLT